MSSTRGHFAGFSEVRMILKAIASNLAASWKVHLISNKSVFLRTSGEAID